MLFLLFPDIALILFGFLLSRKAGWGNDFWTGLEKLNYFWLFPSLLFLSILRNPVPPELARSMVIGALAVVLGCALLAWAGGRRVAQDPVRLASSVQCGFRFNSYIALAVCQRLAGSEGTALCVVAMSVAVPLCNLMAVGALARQQEVSVWRESLKNPLLMATLAGAAGAFIGLRLPMPVEILLERTGQSGVALGLISVGAGLRLTGVRTDRLLMGWMTAVKLLAGPLLAWGAGSLLGMEGTALWVLITFGATPTASTCYVLASRMGGDGPFVAACVTLSTVVAMFTLPLWLTLAGAAPGH